jgi:uncharacterized GH25 family protein
MKPALFKLCAAAMAALSLAGTATAHRAWMLPTSFTLSGDEQWVSVDAAVSNNLFYPNHNALNLESVKAYAPDGTPVDVDNASTGKYRSVFDLKLDRQGTYRISSGGAGYSASWEEGGERKRWRGGEAQLKAEGIFRKPGVTVVRSVRRNETFVTLGNPTSGVFASEGTGLELKPITHPSDVFAGEDVSFALLLDGKPAQGVTVEIVRGNDRYRNSEDALTLITGADGAIAFSPAEAGPYWLSAEHETTGALDGNPIRIVSTYVFTFEALPL